MRRLGAVVLVALAAPARADEAAGTIDQLADELTGRAVAALAKIERAGAADLALSVKARDDAGRIPSLLEGLLLSRLRARAGVRSVAVLEAGDATRASRAGYEAWLDVEVALDGPFLVVTERLVGTDWNPWRPGGGEAIASAAHARVRVDAELRAHLSARPPATRPAPAPATRPTPAASKPPPTPPRKRTTFQLMRFGFDPPDDVLAFAAGDVDADGAVELVALLPHQVIVYALRRDTLVEEQRIPLEGPAPLGRPRQPLGTIVVAGAEILAQSSEHPGVRLGAAGKLATTAGYPILATATASQVPGLRQFGKTQFAETPAPALPDKTIALDGAAGVVASVDPEGLLRLWRVGQKSHFAQLPGAGTAVELADLDDDGRLELISSSSRPAGFGDQLLIRSIRDDGTARVLFKEATRGGIAAIGAGDLDGDGAVDVAAYVRELGARRGELWLVR
jgi:hypothetical protein